jgi:hypothetical protein
MKIECYQKGMKINRTLLNAVNKVCEFHQIANQIQDCFPPPDLHFAYYTGFPII